MTPPSRPRTTSRTPASRPRRVAGRGAGAPADPGLEPAADRAVESPDDESPEVSVEETDVEEAHVVPEPADERPDEQADRADEGAPEPSSLFAGGRVTLVLLVAIVVLTVATLGMAAYLWLDDDPVPAAAAPPPKGEIAVPKGRPIQLPWADAQAAAAAAAEAATTALATSYQDYDAQLTEALALMTPEFAEEFKGTATDSKPGVVEGKLDVAVRVVAQSVVRANTAEVQALLFLDQYTTHADEKQGTTVSPYRVLVTVVHTDGGWLISDLTTK